MTFINPNYADISNKVKTYFGKEIVSLYDLRDQNEFKIPSWVWSYCLISKNEYYFGEYTDYERYKNYTQKEFDKLKNIVYDAYEKYIVTKKELLELGYIEEISIPSWARSERLIGKDMISFEDDFMPWCPLIDYKEFNMEFNTASGKKVETKKDNNDVVISEIVNVETVDVPHTETQSINENTQMIPFDMNKFAVVLSKAINEKPQVMKIEDKPDGYYIPDIDKLYIKWGLYTDFENILRRNMFYPCFVTGLSGNGKTLGIEQACANIGREIVITNITQETDEDDLLGGYRLVDGNTVWQDGPVIIAMKRGCPLLLDEIDYGTGKLSCLQSVLSGKPVLIKKTGVTVKPKAGFTVFATANTKGQGDTTGKFAGTKILNEAFLDRFPITLHNPYPPKNVEAKIFYKALEHFRFVFDGGNDVSKDDEDFIMRLAQWCDIIRKTHAQEAITEVISTRRGVDILKSFVIFGNRERAIQVGVERFDEQTRKALAKLYCAVDEQIENSKKKKSGKDLREKLNGIESPKPPMPNMKSLIQQKSQDDKSLGIEWNNYNDDGVYSTKPDEYSIKTVLKETIKQMN